MKHLSFAEIQTVRGLAVPDRLKQCGVAYSVVMTYVPVLCEMAEQYVRARAIANHDGHLVRYILVHDDKRGWGVTGSDGFLFYLGEDKKEECSRLMERLNR